MAAFSFHRRYLLGGLWIAALLSAESAFAARPQLRAVIPGSGPLEGGTDIMIRGSGFLPGAQVTIGGNPCDHAEVMNPGQITCVTPPGNSGVQRMTVRNSNGQEGAWDRAFRYEDIFSIGGNQQATIGSTVSLRPNNAHYVPNFVIISGRGDVDERNASFKVSDLPGTTMIFGIDPMAGTAEALISAYPPVSLSSEAKELAVGKSYWFSHAGGAPPFKYSVIEGGGSIDAYTGEYRTPLLAGPAVIEIMDAVGSRSFENIRNVSNLGLRFPEDSYPAGKQITAEVIGGIRPFSFSITKEEDQEGGSIDSKTGILTTLSKPGSMTIRVTDHGGNFAETQIDVVDALVFSAARRAVAVGSELDLGPSGGFPPYSFSVVIGGGTVDSNGVFSPSEFSGTAVVRMTDSRGNTTDANIRVNPRLEMIPPIKTLYTLETRKLYASGGVPPYEFRILSGSGAVNRETGLYVAPEEPTVATVEVSDAAGDRQSTELAVIADRISWRRISAGVGHSCAVTPSGYRCWGNNRRGQFGDGTRKASTTPARALMRGPISSIAAGGSHTCILVDYGVSCSGDNTYGQLGQPVARVKFSSRPLPVSGLDRGVTAIAAGLFHTCALRNGSVLCWGRNDHDQLGVASRAMSATPVIAIRRGVLGVAVGSSHSCALLDKGMSCWGSNVAGQLGNGRSADSSVPVPVDGLQHEPVMMVAAGTAHTCALSGGLVRCWGYNGSGALGIPGAGNYGRPQLVEGIPKNPEMLVSGVHHSCVLSKDSVYCWGLNSSSQIDADISAPILPATKIPDLPEGILEIAAGSDHACALYADGARCWGRNNYQQLGIRPKRRLRLR